MRTIIGTIAEIRKRNLIAGENHSAFDVAMEMLQTGDSGAPVLDRKDRVVGLVSDTDLLRAVRSPKRLEEILVKEIMARAPLLLEEDTPLAEASRLMEYASVHRLPVIRDGILLGSVARLNLLRGWLGIGDDIV